MKIPYVAIGLLALLAAGCTTVPNGPSQMALPGTGKTFEQFRSDDAQCQAYAFQQIGGQTAEKSAEESAVRSAAIGTAIGAVAGVAIGGRHGASVGAGTGLIFGSASGSEAGQVSARGSQRRYDNAYIQCMYARGHKVPVSADMTRLMQQQPEPLAIDARSIPEPPQGNPPPPPSLN